jgi:uncharacterized protein (DUF1501 family)
MAITRRQFLKRSGLVAAGSVLGPGFFGSPFVKRALADTIGDRYLVVLFLDGGNDGLNTIVPVTNGGGSLRTAYDVARKTGNGGLRLTPGELGATTIGSDPTTGAELALHPALVGLKRLYDLGTVAVIQGCGYPEYSLSHEESRFVWETGNPLGLGSYTGSGWVGRHLALEYAPTEIPGVNVADRVVGEFRQTATSVLAIRSLADFGFPYDYDFPDATAQQAAFAALHAQASGGAQSTQVYVGNSGAATLLASNSYPALHGAYESDRAVWSQLYRELGTGTARGLREVSKIIYGVENGVPNVRARFFQLSNGGYDTHSDQGGGETDGQHYALHREVGDAVQVFYDDCADMGVAHKLCILVWSEFSRRIFQNANGTDHGSQGPMFVIGGTVNGGIYGSHPNIDEGMLDDQGNTFYSQDPNDPFRSIDFRDVYGTVLKRWVNMPHGQILASVLALDTGYPADTYWTMENFDLPFLP